jgi:branched-chain amino acid aminotransferase
LCQQHNIPVFEKNFSLMEVYGADEAFVTGTFAGLCPVKEVDGREITSSEKGPVVERLQMLYQAMMENETAS